MIDKLISVYQAHACMHVDEILVSIQDSIVISDVASGFVCARRTCAVMSPEQRSSQLLSKNVLARVTS